VGNRRNIYQYCIICQSVQLVETFPSPVRLLRLLSGDMFVWNKPPVVHLHICFVQHTNVSPNSAYIPYRIAKAPTRDTSWLALMYMCALNYRKT